MSKGTRIARVLLTSFALVGLAGCIELIPVEPPPVKPAALHLIIQIQNVDDDPNLDLVPVVIAVTLDPGINGRGRPHRVIDDTLWVWQRGLPLREVGPAGRMLLLDTLRLSPAEVWDAPISLRPPRLEGVEPSLAAFDWPLVRKLGPDTLQARIGNSVELTLMPPRIPVGLAPPGQRWGVSFQRRGQWFGFGEDGPVPTTIPIPHDLLVQAGPGTFGVYLSVDQSGAVSPVAADYFAHVAVHQMFYWVLTVMPPVE